MPVKIEELRNLVDREGAVASGTVNPDSLKDNVLNRLGAIKENLTTPRYVDTTDYTMLPAFNGRDQYVQRLQNENNARIDSLAGALGDHTLSREQFDKYPDFAGRYNGYNDYVLNRYQQAVGAYKEHLSTSPVTKNQMVNGYRPTVYEDATIGRVPQNNEALAAAGQQQGRNEMDELLRERWLTAAAVYPKNSPQYEYQQTHLKKIDEQLDAINAKYDIDTTPYSFGKGLGGAVREGISTAATGIGNTLAFAEDIALAPLEWLTGSAAGTLSDNAPFNQLAEQLRLEDEQIRNYYAENVRKGGTAGRAFNAVLSGTVAAAPQAVFALMTGGTSAMTTAGLQATSTAALSPSISGTVMRTIVNTAKDPNFWLAFAQEAGSDYEQALADGASRNAATLYALGAGIMNAYVEVGGGIQTLPQELTGSKAAWRAFVESALDEGKEEIAQGIIERASQNLFYNRGNKLFSTTDENAVINPVTSAKEGAMGAVIGAILGAGETGVTKVSNKIQANAAAKSQAEKNALPNMLGEAFVNAVANNDFSGFNALGVSNNVAQRVVNEYKANGGITSSIIGALMAEAESKARADIQNSPYQIATPEYTDATGTTGFEVPYTQQAAPAQTASQLGNDSFEREAPPAQEGVTPEQQAEIQRVMDEVFGNRVDANQGTGYTEPINPMNTEEAINGQGTDDQSQLGRSSLRGRPADEGVGLGGRGQAGRLYEQDGVDAQRARAARYGADEAVGRAVGWLPDEEVNQYPELKSLRDRYAEDGVSVKFYKGYIPGGVRTDRNGNKYEAKSAGRATRNGKIFVSVTATIAPDKIGGHEYNHEMIARHSDLFALQGQALLSMLTEEERLDIFNLYASRWKSLANPKLVMEEVLCDTYAGIIRNGSPITEDMCNRIGELTDRYLTERRGGTQLPTDEQLGAQALEMLGESTQEGTREAPWDGDAERKDIDSLLEDVDRNREDQDWLSWANSQEDVEPPAEAEKLPPASDEEMDEVRREAAAEQRKKNIERKRTKKGNEQAEIDSLLDNVRRDEEARNQAEQEEFEDKKSREFFGDIYRNAPEESSLEELQREQQEVVDALSNPDLADSVKNTLRQRFTEIQRDIAAITRRQNGLPFAGNDVGGMTQTQLQAEKVQLEDELKKAKNATTRAAIQNRLDEVNEQLNANHTADMPGPTSELEAPPPPKRGRDVPSTSAVFGDKTGVTHVSETEQERWKDDDELVNYLDGTFKTAREAFEFLRELNETADANLKSSINRVAAGPLIDRAAAENDFETVKDLENTYVAGMSEHGTVLSQSMPTTPAARARAIAANMFNRITDQRRLRVDLSGDNKGIHVREMNEQERAEYQKVMEKTKDWTYKAGGIIHAYQMGGHEEDAHLEMYHLLKEICKERGYKMSARDGRTLSSLSTNEIYDTCMAAAIGYMFDKAPRTASQYVRDFQLIAQLLNPTTILKNITTNAVVGPLENLTTLPATIADAILSPIAKLQSKSDVSASNMRTIAPTGRLYQLKNIKAGLNEAKVSIARADINAPSGSKGKYDERVYQLENSSRHATAVGNLLGGTQGVLERLLQIALGTTDSIMSTITEQNVEDSLRKFVGNKNNRIDAETSKLLARRAGAKAYFHSTTEIGEALASLNGALNLLGIGNSGTRTAKILGKEFTVHDFGLGDVFANYARTAGNIAQFGLEYTPLGVIKAMHNLFIMSEANRLVAEGKGNQRYFTRLGSERLGFENLTNQQRAIVAQREAAMSIARPIVGTMLVSALRWLAQMGILMFTDPREDNDDKKASDQAKGLGGVQLNLSAIGRVLNGQYDPGQQDDDAVINVSDFPPLDTLAEVAGVWNELDNENPDAETYLKILSGAMLAAGTVLGNQSMMKTYETISNGIAYRDRKDAEGNELTPVEQAKSAAFDIGTGLAADSITGFVPGWIRRLASATDDYKRDVYADSAAETVWNKIKNAIPGLRQTLPEKLDSFGNPVENDLNGAINTLLNPYPVRNLNISEIDSFVDSIGVYPERKAPSYFTYDTDGDGKSERYNMSTDERRKWHETYTNAYNGVVQQLMDSAHLDELSKDEQKKILSNIKSYSLATAKNEYLDSLGLSYDMTSNTSAQSIAKALGAITQAQEKGSDLDLAQYYIAKREHDRIDDAGGDKVKEFDRWLSSQSWIDETERQILRNTQTFTSIRTEGRIAEDGKKSDSVFENLESFGIGRDASYTIDDALAAAKEALPEGEELRDWQKYEAIAGANVSDADKLKAILYYERAERANGPTMRERTQQAYDEGFSIDDIVAYKKLCSDYSKLGDRAMHFDEYGLDNRTYFRLKYIYSQ